LRDFSDYLENKDIEDLDNVSPGIVAGYLRGLSDIGLSAKTVARHMSSVRNLFRFLISEGILKRDPTEGLKPPKLPENLPDIVSVEQMESLINAIDLDSAKGLGIRDRAILETMYATGMRESEVINLNTDDVYEDIGFVRVFGKGSKERLVPINGQALYWIDRYSRDVRPKLQSKKRSTILFLNFRGGQLSRMGLYKIVVKWAKKAGLDNVHPHTIRHAFATHLIEGGADLIAVQEMLGHADISTTQIYTNISRKHLHKVYHRYHPRGKD